MARNPNFTVSFSGKDRSGENYRFTINTDAAYDVSTYASGDHLYDFVNVNVAAVCDGHITNLSSNSAKKLSTVAHATDGQREQRWICFYHDNTTLAPYTLELPCLDPAVKPPLGTDEVDLTAVPWAAFLVAFNLAVFSPDGNPCTLDKVILGGSNN